MYSCTIIDFSTVMHLYMSNHVDVVHQTQTVSVFGVPNFFQQSKLENTESVCINIGICLQMNELGTKTNMYRTTVCNITKCAIIINQISVKWIFILSPGHYFKLAIQNFIVFGYNLQSKIITGYSFKHDH